MRNDRGNLPSWPLGGKGRGAIFRRGEIVRTVEERDFLPALMAEVRAALRAGE